ncbi:MAG: hypothetical protein DA328_07605, partial [Nitrososphaeraceae archaeon]|nr:hypothetical protein [Nitrososphaeraceae archaeon]
MLKLYSSNGYRFISSVLLILLLLSPILHNSVYATHENKKNSMILPNLFEDFDTFKSNNFNQTDFYKLDTLSNTAPKITSIINNTVFSDNHVQLQGSAFEEQIGIQLTYSSVDLYLSTPDGLINVGKGNVTSPTVGKWTANVVLPDGQYDFVVQGTRNDGSKSSISQPMHVKVDSTLSPLKKPVILYPGNNNIISNNTITFSGNANYTLQNNNMKYSEIRIYELTNNSLPVFLGQAIPNNDVTGGWTTNGITLSEGYHSLSALGFTDNCIEDCIVSPFSSPVNILIDYSAPVIVGPPYITVEATELDGAKVPYETNATDVFDSDVSIKCNPKTGKMFPLGQTIVKCTAIDDADNTSIFSFNVNVTDTTPPIITGPESLFVEASSPYGNITNFMVNATDIVDEDVLITCTPTSGSFFLLGVTTVNCSAEDDALNIAEFSFDVEVQDNIPQAEVCNSGIDEDLDNKVDLFDEDCNSNIIIEIVSAINGQGLALSNAQSDTSDQIFITFSAQNMTGAYNFECSLDSSPFGICTSPIGYDNLTSGTHIFNVRLAELPLKTTSFTWITSQDKIQSESIIDYVKFPNDASVSKQLTHSFVIDNLLSPDSIEFGFSAKDNSINHFECKVDNDPFSICSSPNKVSGLSAGTHTFSVKGMDNFGNVESIESFSADVPVLAEVPVQSMVSIQSDCPGPGGVGTNQDDTIVDTDASTTINGGQGQDDIQGCGGDDEIYGEEGIDTLDGGDGNDLLVGGNGADILTGGPGEDTFDCGHGPDTVTDYNPDEDTLIDCENAIVNITPDTTIDAATDGNTNPVTDGGTTSSTEITFDFSGTPTLYTDHFICSLSGPVPSGPDDPCNLTGVSSDSKTYTGLTDGEYTFTVAAVSTSNTPDPTPATFAFTVDTTAPDTTIDAATDGNLLSVTDGGTTSSTEITFDFSGTPATDTDHFICSLSGPVPSGPDDPCNLTGVSSDSKTYTGLTDGDYTFTVAAVDINGNADLTPATFAFTVDTTAPDTTIDAATDGNLLSVTDGGTTSSTEITFDFSGTPATDTDHFICSLSGPVPSGPDDPCNLTGVSSDSKTYTGLT